MKSAALGTSTSPVEVTNVSTHGFWIFVGERELFVSFRDFPWFKDASNVVIAGKSRPLSKDYGQVSDVVRTTTSAVLARTKKPEEGVNEIESRLARVMR